MSLRCPQTYSLPGFSANIQVQIEDFKEFLQPQFRRRVNCYQISQRHPRIAGNYRVPNALNPTMTIDDALGWVSDGYFGRIRA